MLREHVSRASSEGKGKVAERIDAFVYAGVKLTGAASGEEGDEEGKSREEITAAKVAAAKKAAEARANPKAAAAEAAERDREIWGRVLEAKAAEAKALKEAKEAKEAMGAGDLSAEGRATLHLAARVAELEKLGNRHDYQLTHELPQLRAEVKALRRHAATSEGRLGRLEREVAALQRWVSGYPELYAANIRASVGEDWFKASIAQYSAENLSASGVPQRLATAEQGVAAVGKRLARTQRRAVAEAVSTLVGQLCTVGFLKPGKSTGDPDAQFEINVTTSAAAAKAMQCEAAADAASAGSGDSEAPDAGAEEATSTATTFSTPVDLKEVEAKLERAAGDVETATQAVEELETSLKLCVTKDDLDKALDLESEEALANPMGNPLLRMKAGLEKSLANAAAAAEAKAAANLEASRQAQAEALAATEVALAERCDGLLQALQASDDAAAALGADLAAQNERLGGVDEALKALPDPTAQLEDLAHGQIGLLAADGKLEKRMAAAIAENDSLKIGLQKLAHEFHHAGYCKAAALHDLEDRLEQQINTCLDNVSALGDGAGDMHAALSAAATMAQVRVYVEKALNAAASRLQPPDDTAMATTFRCLGCNQKYPSMHDRAANPVPHQTLPGLPGGPSSAAPETKRVFRHQWGVMLSQHELVNAGVEAKKKTRLKQQQQQQQQRGGLDLGKAGGTGSRRQPRAGGLQPLGAVHVPWTPVTTPQQQQRQGTKAAAVSEEDLVQMGRSEVSYSHDDNDGESSVGSDPSLPPPPSVTSAEERSQTTTRKDFAPAEADATTAGLSGSLQQGSFESMGEWEDNMAAAAFDA